jgi:hypothetical protein
LRAPSSLRLVSARGVRGSEEERIAVRRIVGEILSYALCADRGFKSEFLRAEQVAPGLTDFRDVRLFWIGAMAGEEDVRTGDVRLTLDSDKCERANELLMERRSSSFWLYCRLWQPVLGQWNV